MAAHDGPHNVAAMLDDYRRMLAANGYDWGHEIEGGITPLLQFADRCDEQRWMVAFGAWKAAGTLDDPIGALVHALADPLPTGVAVVKAGGVRVGQPLPYALPGRPYRYDVIIADGAGCIREVMVDRNLEVDGLWAIAATPAAAGHLLLVADGIARWSVTDDRGGGWFPQGAPHRYDATGRPFCHGNELLVDVPAGAVTVAVARGCEFELASLDVVVAADEQREVRLSPRRLYQTASRGWYGADLHVHMNYTGDQVVSLDEVEAIQRGEGLHLLNLVAANYSTALVYDQPALAEYVGRDLPWSGPDAVCRLGVEYRNDMYGHFHALGPVAPPVRFSTGHPRSGNPYDWPPNATAAAELRALGATIGYTHPVAVAVGCDGSPDAVFARARARSYEARELVADAALGLVDSVDLLTGNTDGTEYLYHRLLGCGLRLAATAGTDVMLSRSRGRLTSNPPGWSRTYADLGDEPLSVAAWQAAVRACRTFATNGPWLELAVAGHGPGETIVITRPGRLEVSAKVIGQGVERLEIIGPDGPVLACTVDPAADRAELVAEIEIRGPIWLAAVARGELHPLAVGGRPNLYGHTSPAWVQVGGRQVARPADARWCLDWLNRFERLAREEGRFANETQFADLAAVIEAARVRYQEISASSALI
jgi:hypothetical protein